MQRGSFVVVLDSSGARLAKCIQVIKQPIARPAGRAIVVIKSAFPKKRAVKSAIFHSAVIQLRRPQRRFFGNRVGFSQNGVVLLKRGEWLPFATRVSKSMFRETRRSGFGKLASLALSLF
jgi:ribosomal protein L14